jgi:hypothetical protein
MIGPPDVEIHKSGLIAKRRDTMRMFFYDRETRQTASGTLGADGIFRELQEQKGFGGFTHIVGMPT